MAPLVTVVGDATVDVRASPEATIRPGRDVPASIALGAGGQGANIAVRLARRGMATRLVCRIGADAAGDLVRAAVSGDGVELVDLGAPATGTIVVLLDASGERTMLSQRMPLLEGGPPPVSVLETDWLVVSGYVLLEPSAGISASGDVPRRVIAGCSLEPGQAGDWARAARSLQPHLVVLNVDEAVILDGTRGEPGKLSRRVGEALGAMVVVTEPSGATAVLAEDAIRTTTQPESWPLDTTGAGDAFTAGLVAGLIDAPWPPSHDQLEAAMHAAGTLAAAVTRVAGAQGRVPGERGAA